MPALSKSRQVAQLATDIVSVKDFGAVGDGVTDDTAAIEAADTALTQGGTLYFERGKTYLCGSTVDITNAGKLDLNGSTIKASSAISAQLVAWQKLISSYTSPADYTAFSVTANQATFNIPVGVTVAPGNVVKLMSNTERVTGYNHGMMATVVSVSGGVATLNTSFYASFQVDSIRVYRGYQQMEVCNGTFDLLDIGSAVSFTEGILLRGSNAYVHDCIFVGSQYAGIGVRVESDGSLIENCKAYGFRNTQGEPGGGRVGYGFAGYGNNTVIANCHAFSCKHGIASGGRDIVSQNVHYKSCKVYEDAAAASSDYSGSIDMHYNVTGEALIEDCYVVGQSRLLSLRCPNATVRGGTFIQSVGGIAVEGFDAPYDGLTFENVSYSLATTGSYFLAISSSSPAVVNGFQNILMKDCRGLSSVGRLIEFSRETTVANVVIDNCEHNGGSLFRTNAGNITSLTLRNNRGTLTEGAFRIVMDGATYSVTDIVVDGNTFSRNVATSNDNVLFLYSPSATRIACTRLSVRNNVLVHSDDTGNGYSINLIKIAATFLELSNNRISRGTFRCISMDGCSVIRGIVRGQIIDGTFFVQNNAAATVLTDVTVIGNAGDTYSVLVTGSGITKTRYVDASNNFVTYTP